MVNDCQNQHLYPGLTMLCIHRMRKRHDSTLMQQQSCPRCLGQQSLNWSASSWDQILAKQSPLPTRENQTSLSGLEIIIKLIFFFPSIMLVQGFSTLALFIFCCRILCLHCAKLIFSSLRCLYPFNANSISQLVVTTKMSPDIAR